MTVFGFKFFQVSIWPREIGFPGSVGASKMLNVKFNSDYSVSSHCAGTEQMREESESGIRK